MVSRRYGEQCQQTEHTSFLACFLSLLHGSKYVSNPRPGDYTGSTYLRRSLSNSLSNFSGFPESEALLPSRPMASTGDEGPEVPAVPATSPGMVTDILSAAFLDRLRVYLGLLEEAAGGAGVSEVMISVCSMDWVESEEGHKQRQTRQQLYTPRMRATGRVAVVDGIGMYEESGGGWVGDGAVGMGTRKEERKKEGCGGRWICRVCRCLERRRFGRCCRTSLAPIVATPAV